MSENQTALSEREEIEMLLPWYAAGTLNRAETSRVETYLEAHPDIGAQLALIRDEQAETIGINESLGAPASGALDRLMSAIESESGPLNLSARPPESLWQRLSGWIGDLSPRPLALAAAVAVTVVCIQAAVLGVLVSGDGAKRFQTASGGEEALTESIGTFALVGFAGTASMDDINTLLNERSAGIVAGPLPGGLYRIRLSPEQMTPEQRDAALAALRAENSLVTFAAPTR